MSEHDIFAEALGYPDAAARAAFVRRACGADAAAANRIARLLTYAAAESPLLERLPVELLAGAPAQTGDGGPRPAATGHVERVGTVLAGRYELLELIGEGGMGSVYRARQSEPVTRDVAVKLIRPGFDSAAVIARFEAERQTLAHLAHPNVAQVYDGGTTESGQPFFVMEYIAGEAVTRYCDARRLPPAARLDLFVTVCEAVHHAHQKGIIHRDLKPGNVLVCEVDGRPVPKVIDFGVSKAVAPGSIKDREPDTDGLVGTPEYMSPEQAEPGSAAVDIRTDIYSLGVVLYELLVGVRPLDLGRAKGDSFLERLRALRETAPPRPSTALSAAPEVPAIAARRSVSPVALARLLRGELDWVVMTALAKDPAARYQSALELAADVRRHRAGEVVLAVPPSRRYRVGKVLARHRRALAAAALLFATLIAGVVGTSVGLVDARRQWRETEQARASEAEQRGLAEERYREAERARDREARERARREAAYAKTTDVLDVIASEMTGDALAAQREVGDEQKKLLTQVLGYYREFADLRSDEAPGRERAARAAYRVGLIEVRLGRKEDALRAFQAARDGFAALAADFPAAPEYRGGVAANDYGLGLLLTGLKRPAEGERHHRLALALREQLAAEFPAEAPYRRDLADTHNCLGLLLRDQGKWVEAEEQFRRAIAVQEALAAGAPGDRHFARALAGSYHNLGNLLPTVGKAADAEDQHRRALALLEKLAADFPAEAAIRRDLANTHNDLGALLRDRGKPADAEAPFRRAVALLEKLTADFPSVPDYRSELAAGCTNVGIRLSEQGNVAGAEQAYRKALALRAALAADFPAVPAYRGELAGIHHLLGNFLGRFGKPADAEEEHRRALTIREKLAAEFPDAPQIRRDLAISHNGLGIVLADQGKWADADARYRAAAALREKLAAEFPVAVGYRVELGGTYCNIGNLARDQARPAESLDWYRKAIDVLQPVHAADPRNRAGGQFLMNSHWGRAMALDGLGQPGDAVRDWDRAIEVCPEGQRLHLRARRVASRLNAGQAADAVADADELTKSPSWVSRMAYDLARVYAVASGRPAGKKREHASRAMELLARAVRDGFKDLPRLKADPDLDPLRERDDFKKLLQGLEAK